MLKYIRVREKRTDVFPSILAAQHAQVEWFELVGYQGPGGGRHAHPFRCHIQPFLLQRDFRHLLFIHFLPLPFLLFLLLLGLLLFLQIGLLFSSSSGLLPSIFGTGQHSSPTHFLQFAPSVHSKGCAFLPVWVQSAPPEHMKAPNPSPTRIKSTVASNRLGKYLIAMSTKCQRMEEKRWFYNKN